MCLWSTKSNFVHFLQNIYIYIYIYIYEKMLHFVETSLRMYVRNICINSISFLYLHAKYSIFFVYGSTASSSFLALLPSRPTLNDLLPSFYRHNVGYSGSFSNVADCYVRDWNFPLLVVRLASILIGKRGDGFYFGVPHAWRPAFVRLRQWSLSARTVDVVSATKTLGLRSEAGGWNPPIRSVNVVRCRPRYVSKKKAWFLTKFATRAVFKMGFKKNIFFFLSVFTSISL